MPRKLKVTDKQIADALTASGGTVSVAAKQLDITPKTIYERMKTSDAIQAVFESMRERTADRIEATLLDLALGRQRRVLRTDPATGEQEVISDWVQKPDVTALIFVAKTHPAMRQRGWGAKTYNEVSGTDGGAIKTQNVNVNMTAHSEADALEIIKIIQGLDIRDHTSDSDDNSTPE